MCAFVSVCIRASVCADVFRATSEKSEVYDTEKTKGIFVMHEAPCWL